MVPNGVDSDFFTPAPSHLPVEPWSLAFTGMMAYVPNHDGIKWFLDEVFPLIVQRVPKAKLYVVGKNPPPHITQRESESVRVTGTVPDVRPYVWKAAAYVVPLRMGGGTRLKIAEAMAMKKPIVSTRIGCEGIELVDGESALLADDPKSFADATVRLLEDQALAARLAGKGYLLAKAKYDWRSIGDTLDAIYREHLPGPGARGRMKFTKPPPDLVERFEGRIAGAPRPHPEEDVRYRASFVKGNFFTGLHNDNVGDSPARRSEGFTEDLSGAPQFRPDGRAAYQAVVGDSEERRGRREEAEGLRRAGVRPGAAAAGEGREEEGAGEEEEVT